MPRIQAPTVVEHRAAQRAALLEAAREILAESGAEAAPGLAEVGSRAGLARSSVYSYFASREDLFDALVADTLPRWVEYVDRQIARARTPGEKVLAYVEANLHLVARGDHALLCAMAALGRGGDAAAGSERDVHGNLQRPLRDALAAHGAADPEHMADLVQSVVFSGSRMIEDGLSEPRARALVRELLGPYLG